MRQNQKQDAQINTNVDAEIETTRNPHQKQSKSLSNNIEAKIHSSFFRGFGVHTLPEEGQGEGSGGGAARSLSEAGMRANLTNVTLHIALSLEW